jgi:cation:H+ antiporter
VRSILYLELAGGLVWLLMGGDLLVRGSVALARKLRVSPTLIALTVIAFGTSLPELVVVLRATHAGYPDLAIGNVVGSNIANVLLVAGLAAVVCPLVTSEGNERRDGTVMVAVSILFLAMCWSGWLSLAEGIILLGVLALITAITAREAARAYREAVLTTPIEWVLGLPSSVWTIVLFIVFGAVGLPLGARLVVDGAAGIAADLQVSESLVGLTILAVSTSLPELATTVVAAVRDRTEVVVGAVVGSNIFNILAITGVAAVAGPSPIPVARGFLIFDLPVMLGAALVLAALVWLRRPIGRAAGVMLLAGYAVYVLALVMGVGAGGH